MVQLIMPVERKSKNEKMPITNIQTKEDKYNPLVDAIRAQGWNVRPLIVIIAGVRGAIHTSIKLLENLHIPLITNKKNNENHSPNSHQISHISNT